MTSANNTPRSVLTRRNFVKGTLAMAAAGTFLPGCKHSSGSGSNTIPVPPDFPQSISLYQQTFINWARETIIPDVWFCSPANPEDVITVANWAKRHDYQLRPYGSGHGFAPTILPRGNSGRKVVLVNTSEYLNKITVDADSSVKTVTAQAGAYLEAICIELEKYDLGFYHTTAPGDVSIAGVLAMNAHGAALPATGETLQAGHSWGSLSNLILSITAVAWNDAKSEYELKTFQRDDPLIGPLLTCLARAFITEVTLQVGPNLKVRCQSSCNLKVDDLLDAPENNNPDSFANLSDTYGTVDILFYPFAPDGTAWVKTWTVTPTKPSTSREVLEPYNYHALAMTPEQADQLTKQLQANNGAWVPNYNELARNGIASLIQDTDPTTQVYDL
ncbi:MAG TPA: cholesterol oxidase substrate-binding domain-containing protein, partial [Pseudomonadales bacterium]|nr:cholesterol oxidase substrate-binding domain-containing protein [Pseudomonadales bacterium]